ncbi:MULTISPECIES: hypothetical protein [Paenibacillus]|uniref:hypothetical protein n=1 Tax=Paenibacillus TaxID=44249 RepID=UPI0018CDEAAA|nr:MULTISPECIES: hypothetical protein [Paenibacillus]MBG9736212.1 hypothetical protein [Paenibacillus alvei]MBG9745911.1 hypothetical protein [Paenibacillus alvei]MCY9582686.1 hypothetical protein [Paenibacillus alvei]MCY9587968.1 hypothetical protein [Paenibacillus alvei]
MKKALIVFGTTATLLASVLAPTAGFAATKTEVATNSVSMLAESKVWVSNIQGDDYWYKKSNVAKTYFYVRGNMAGKLKLHAYRIDGDKIWGLYEGYIYKKGDQ